MLYYTILYYHIIQPMLIGGTNTLNIIARQTYYFGQIHNECKLTTIEIPQTLEGDAR